eukprot:g3514.t1
MTCCSFSEQEVADCTNRGADKCNVGGEPHDGIMEVVARRGRISSEASYPYVSGKTKKLTPCEPSSSGTVATGITGYVNVTSGSEAALVQAVAQHGVVSVGIDASSFGFQLYTSGIYVDSEGCGNNDTSLDHGVAVTGFGSGKPSPPGPLPPPPGPANCEHNFYKDECLKEKGCHWCIDKPSYCFNEACPSSSAGGSSSSSSSSLSIDAAVKDYWMVRNSWSINWGMGGYIAMARNHDNMCGVATDAVYAVI